MNHMIQINNDFTAFVQSVQCAPSTLTHDLRRSRHWSIAASITLCSKSTQVCVKRFCRSQMSQICFVNALLHDTPEFYNLQVHFNEEYTIHLIPFSLVISHCYNITFSLFWISQRSVATLIRWRGWSSYPGMCSSFLNLIVKTALKSVNICRRYRQN